MEADGLAAAARRAEAWAGEPFLRPDEDAAEALAEGRARRRALDDALAEMEAGRRTPSPSWKIRYALMLGLERELTDHPPRLASGTELRRHQIDALAGMLTELIARHEEEAENGNGNGNGHAVEEPEDEEEHENDDLEDEEGELDKQDDPGAVRRFRFRHPTASGKTIAAAGFVEAARTMGVLILTHRRLLVQQFTRDLTTEGYADRLRPAIEDGQEPLRGNPITIQTYAWFARHVDSISKGAYQLVICDEAHTALGEKTSSAIRRFADPIYIGMTATEQLIAKQVSDVFPASVDDLPLADAARRGLIAPLRCLRVPPAAAVASVPIVGGDYDQDILARVLDHSVINQAAASLYRDRFGETPGIVYAAGVEHAYNLAREFRAAGLKAEAVSGKTPPLKLAETLAAYERGEINILINAMLLAEGWNSPRATVCMHLAPTASRRVYQQRIGRIMRMHPRKEAGVVVDFVPDAATHNERTITLHSLLDSDFYRPGARVTPAPRRRVQRRARRKLSPAPWLVPVTPDVRRRVAVITREWERVDPSRLADDEQLLWARIAGRQLRFEERQHFAEKLAKASRECREAFLMSCAAENPNRRLRLSALGDRVAVTVDRASFDDLVTMITSAPTWEKDRVQGVRILLRADRRGEGGRAGGDPLPLDLAARPRHAQAAGPARRLGPAGGEAPPRRPDELTRAPARGERGAARQRRARAADPRGRRSARVRGGLHADRAAAHRPHARAARDDSGGRERAGGQSARPEAAFRQVSAPAAQAEAEGGAAEGAAAEGGEGQGAEREGRRERSPRGRRPRSPSPAPSPPPRPSRSD